MIFSRIALFAIVVVAKNPLYTTTNGLGRRLCFGVGVGVWLLAGCDGFRKQRREVTWRKVCCFASYPMDFIEFSQNNYRFSTC
jgi:hypothetical protein